MGITDGFKGYPIQVFVIRAYGNDLGIEIWSGRYEKRSAVSDMNTPITSRHTLIKKGRFDAPLSLPVFSQSVYAKLANKQQLILLQIDLNTFYPVTIEKDKFLVWIPNPRMRQATQEGTDAEGKVQVQGVFDDQGKPVLIPVRDKDNKVVFDDVAHELYNSNLVVYDQEGKPKVTNLPHLVTKLAYDADQWQALEYDAAERQNRVKGSNWAALAPYLMMIIVVVLVGGLWMITNNLQNSLKYQSDGAVALGNGIGKLADVLNASNVTLGFHNATEPPAPTPGANGGSVIPGIGGIIPKGI